MLVLSLYDVLTNSICMFRTQICMYFSPFLIFVFTLYSSFKQFVENLEEEIGYEKNYCIVEQISVPCAAVQLSKDEISLVIKDMLESSHRSLKSKALDRYRSIGEEFYLEARHMDEKVKHFETKIQRRYFDATPLHDDQLINWHLYLDFIEKQDNLDSVSFYRISCFHM